MNIAICGLISEPFIFFYALKNDLSHLGHKVFFVEPEYSGAVCLIKEKHDYFTHKSIGETKKNVLHQEFDEILKYELAILEGNKNKFTKRLNLLAGEICAFYESFFHNNKIDMILIWNGYSVRGKAAKYIANKLGIKKNIFERSVFPFYLQVDDEGINTYNSHKQTLCDYQLQTVNLRIDDFQNLVQKKLDLKNPLDVIKIKYKVQYYIKEKEYSELGYRVLQYITMQKSLSLKSKKKVFIFNSISLGNLDYIFVPLQVSTDTQLLMCDNLIKTNVELIENVLNSVSKLNSTWKVVFKIHPQETGKEAEYLNVIEKYNNAVVTNTDTIELIKNSKLVISINSSVGFEALLWQKSVILLGNSIYDNFELIYKVAKLDELKNLIQTNFGKQLDRNLVEKYANRMLNILIECDFTNPSSTQLDNIISYINKVYQQ
ncbi:MAG: hypothetical protein A2068_09720 [Ignavibacteria bacterium GWB2_35_6b]|nr:MAG: hypothetical protein A2068_09720 [Ignavibacteria bacterium GWB2_35_6b]